MLESILGIVVVIALMLAAYAYRLMRSNAELERANSEYRRSSESTLRYAESITAREAAIAQVVNEALIIVSPARDIVFANERARAIFGAEDLSGRRFSEVAWGFDLAPVLDDALAGKVESIQQTVVREQRAFLAKARPIGPRAEYGAAIALQDVTELQRLGRARRDFVANISHELRTPLASIKLLVETLGNGAIKDPALGPEMVGKIDVQVDSLRQLADELFDLAQIESGQAPLRLTEAGLPSLVAQTLERFALQAERGQISLRSECPELTALVDTSKFDKVLGNLVHNAIKFTPAGGSITVSAQPQGDMICVSVQDTGQGIPAHEQPRVFERFYQVDRARSREKGTGLGLAIAKHIVEAHGGTIWLTSKEGEGTVFHFTVPQA